MNNILEVKNLYYKIGSKYILKNINWQIKEGENWLIYGMNGCGKTMLLTILAGYSRFSQGEITIFDEKYDENNIGKLRQKIGWVSSSFFDKIYYNETVLYVLAAAFNGFLGIDKWPKDWQVKEIQTYLDFFHLKDKLNMPYGTLSKGEKQKVLLIRALLTKPQILILDEVSSGLDIVAKAQLRQFLHDLVQKEALTIIYVSHMTEEISGIFDHCLLMKEGKVLANGLTDDILQPEILSQAFETEIKVEKHKGKYLLEEEMKNSLYNFWKGDYREDVSN